MTYTNQYNHRKLFTIFARNKDIMGKRIYLGMLLAMTFVLSATAQDAVSVIRKHYTETQQKIEAIEKEEIPQEYYEVKILQNLPGTGPHQEVMRLYYNVKDNEDWQPDEPMLTRDLHFVTWKYNYAAREFYEEYLQTHTGQRVYGQGIA